MVQRVAASNRQAPTVGHQQGQPIQIPQSDEKAANHPPGNQFGSGLQPAQQAIEELVSGVRVQMASTLDQLQIGISQPDSSIGKLGPHINPGRPKKPKGQELPHSRQHPTNQGPGTT